ncbi:MAG: hypothetical protein ACERKD_06525 [Prolixibacteraceae bacterium]
MNQVFKFSSTLAFLLTTLLVFPQSNSYVNKGNKSRLKIYVDGIGFDFDYLREEINFIDFVNDPFTADVQIIAVEEPTGSGGSNYSVRFHSRTFNNISDFTLNIPVIPKETSFNKQHKFTNTIIYGLMPFFNETSSSDNYKLHFELLNDSTSQDNTLSDKWKNWVFSITSSGGFNVEQSKSGYNYAFIFKGDKVTDKIKINNFIYVNNRVTDYKDLGYVYRYNYKYAFSKVVYSLSEHWSSGITLYPIQSSYYNKRFAIAAMGALEYNFFPWSESNEHIVSLAYSLGYEKLFFYKKNYRSNIQENMPLHRIYITGSTVQPWGDISVNLTGSEYLNDLSLYNLSFGADFSVRIAKGLSLTLNIMAISIHDQIYIPEDSYTVEQIISESIKLPTSFELSGSIGFTYQFGSIYNNIINRRL